MYIYIYVYALACACWRPSLDQFAVGLAYIIYYMGMTVEPRSILPGEREKSWHRFNDLLLLLYTSGRSACQFSQLVGSACVCVFIYIYNTSSTGPSSPRTRGVCRIYTPCSARANNRSKRIKQVAHFTVRTTYAGGSVPSSSKRIMKVIYDEPLLYT